MMRLLLPLLAIAAPAAAAGIERFPADSPLPLAKAVRVPAGSETLYLSGQIASPIDPAKPFTAALTLADMGDTRVQTISALAKIKALLEADGYRLGDVVKLTVFLVGDPAKGGKWDFAGMNEGFRTVFGTAANPAIVARSTVQVTTVAHPASLVEIEAIAAKAPAG